MGGGHLHPGGQVAAQDQLREHRGGGPVGDGRLERRPDGVQDLLEDRHVLALTGVQFAQFGQGQIGDGPRTVGGPVHLGVVHGDEDAVLAQPEVQGDGVHAGTFR